MALHVANVVHVDVYVVREGLGGRGGGEGGGGGGGGERERERE